MSRTRSSFLNNSTISRRIPLWPAPVLTLGHKQATVEAEMTLVSDFPVTASASGSFFKWLGRFFAIPEFDPLSETERRTHLRDLMDRHPEAFESEISVQGLMSLYPHSF